MEPAWQRATGGDRELLQGLIQAAAAFHKFLVQGNARGAATLLGWSEERLVGAPPGAWGLDLGPFREELAAWRARLLDGTADLLAGPIFGLPRLDWTPQGDGERLLVERIDLYLLELGVARAALVRLQADGVAGWGECRLAWDAPGAWPALVTVLAPALIAEPVAAPTEVGVLWAGLVADPRPGAALEAALWDLWARRYGWSLATALGIDLRPIPLLGRAEGTTSAMLAADAQRLVAAGYRQVLLPARPNADRRLLPGIVDRIDVPIGLDLGAAYRIADLDALRVLDDCGVTFLHQPFPLDLRHSYARLCRYLDTPVSAGSFASADAAEDAIHWAAADAVAVDPGLVGPTEAIRMLEVAAARRRPAWIASSAATSIGLAVDSVLAMHANCAWPADLSTACDDEGRPIAVPDANGKLTPSDAPPVLGIGTAPDPAWLERVTVQHAHLAAS